MILSMLLAVAEPVECPPKGTAARDRMKLAGELCNDEPLPKPAAPLKASPPFKERPLTAAEKAAIIKAADLVLFDGVSARWQWGPRKSDFAYCGQVNAKNRFGAYAGWAPFYFTEGKFRIVGDDDKGARIVYDAICSGAGYIETPDWLKSAS